MRPFAAGLRARLLLLVFFALVPAFALIGYTGVGERHKASVQAGRDATNLVRVVSREQSRLILAAGQLLLSVSKRPELRDPQTKTACERVLADLLKPHPYYTNFGVADASGRVYCSATPLAPLNIGDRAYFQRAMQSGAVGVGDYEVGSVSKVPQINVARAIVDEKGDPRGIVFAALDLSWLNQLLGRTVLAPGSAMLVVSSEGTILASHPEPAKWNSESLRDSAVFNAAVAKGAEGMIEAKGLDGVRRFYAFAPLHGSLSANMYVVVGISEETVLGGANEVLRRSLSLLLVVAMLAFGAVWLGCDALVLSRIHALAHTARRLHAGDLAARTGLPPRADEIGQLARTFDGMATSMQRVNRALKSLKEGNRAVLGATDERALLTEMCRIVVEVGGYRCAWVGYTENDERRSIRPRAQVGHAGGLQGLTDVVSATWDGGLLDRGPVGMAILTAKPRVARALLKAADSPWRDDAVRNGYASAASFPLSVNGEVIGALAVYAEEPDAFDVDEFELLTEVAQDLAFGIALLRTRSEQERAHATIERMAFYDKLTGLPNHSRFEERLRRVLSEARSFDRVLALLIIDLTHLRDINDAFGFHYGDQLLKEVSTRIAEIVPKGGVLARMRGDEFGVVVTVKSREQAADLAEHILRALGNPFLIKELKLNISGTIGISLFPAHGKEGPKLMRHADIAMHEAKKLGKGHMFYELKQEEDRVQRLSVVAELRHAIETNELTLHFQPKVNVAQGNICGVEALVRWIHPKHGILAPDKFIPLAEQSGLIKPLTDWVIGAALQQSARWRAGGIALPIAVNLSPYNLRDVALIDKVERLLHEWDAGPSWLELEITESALMDDPEQMLQVLKRLKDMGLALFIDDFGIGYSSLAHLKKRPVDYLKIDKSFVIDMTDDDDCAAIVRSTISIGHELNLKVVAEGVESDTALDRLTALGCDVVQGYFIGKPLPADEFELWLAHQTWSRPAATRAG